MSYGFSTYRCGNIRKMFSTITKVRRRNVYKFLKEKFRAISTHHDWNEEINYQSLNLQGSKLKPKQENTMLNVKKLQSMTKNVQRTL